mgnify:CR=1 FL=1
MIKFIKALFGGISLTLAYCAVMVSSPIILKLLGYSNINSSPDLFGYPLYIIRMHGNTFHSEATPLGLILSLVIGIVIYYAVAAVAKLALKKNEIKV